MPFSLTYETVKYVNIKDARLAILRSFLLFAIVIYVGVFEMWGQGGWLESSPVVGVVRFSLQQPTVNNCSPNDEVCQNAFQPLTELPYCQQATKNDGNTTGYPGTLYPCEIYEATNAQIVSEKSIAIITRASTRKEELVCGEADMVCPRTYNATSTEHKFYTAQSEAFTILFDHSVTSSKICTKRNNYACSSEASKYQGRLYSKNDHFCAQEFAKGTAYSHFRGQKKKANAPRYISLYAPCYISPNTTIEHQNLFSLGVLLKSVDVSLDDCNSAVSQGGACCIENLPARLRLSFREQVTHELELHDIFTRTVIPGISCQSCSNLQLLNVGDSSLSRLLAEFWGVHRAAYRPIS